MNATMLAVPELDDLEVVFGSIKHFPKCDDLPDDFRSGRHPCCQIAQTLFFHGGSLEDFGLTAKAGIDRRKALRAIRAGLCSFVPKHEHKIAAVGFMFDQWFDRAAK